MIAERSPNVRRTKTKLAPKSTITNPALDGTTEYRSSVIFRRGKYESLTVKDFYQIS